MTLVAKAMAGSEHALVSEAILGIEMAPLAVTRDARSQAPTIRAGALSLAAHRGGLGECLLERALAARLAGNRQLRRPGGHAADERRGAPASRDLDWCTPTELTEQPGAVLLR